MYIQMIPKKYFPQIVGLNRHPYFQVTITENVERWLIVKKGSSPIWGVKIKKFDSKQQFYIIVSQSFFV